MFMSLNGAGFPEDIRRRFVITGEFVRKAEVRERIVYLGGLSIINVLPDDVEPDMVS